MQLDLEIRDGRPDLPAVILVHGLGMNRHFWGAPAGCQALGGLASLTIFLAGPPAGDTPERFSTGKIRTCRGLADLLAKQGIGVASWSQRFPMGAAGESLAELVAVGEELKKRWSGRPLYLVGHSRGGLLARAYLLEHGDDRIAGLATLGTPHAGSRMASFSTLLRPAGHRLAKLLPRGTRSSAAAALSRLAVFLESPAIGELEPDSEFIRTISRPLPSRLRKLSLGGTEPALFHLYLRATSDSPWKAIVFPEFLLKAVPSTRLPAELTPGLGDGLVSARSAILPGACHSDLDCNHVGLAFEPRAQQALLDFLLSPTQGHG
jgi:pimeloyl-ACP methyl ester carboxylesterase